MKRLLQRAGWVAAGALAVAVALAAATAVRGGSLEPPPGAPASTLQPLRQMPPDWWTTFVANNGDGNGCGSSRFECVMFHLDCTGICHFTIDGVLDHETGLVWQRSLTGAGSLVSWEGAEGSCLNYTGGGTKGWRLPTAAELMSLADPNVVSFTFGLPAGAPFGSIPNGPISVWTTTRDISNTQNIYTVRLRSSQQGDPPTASLTDVNILSGAGYICVRGAE